MYFKYIKWETEVELKVRRIKNLIRRHNLFEFLSDKKLSN